MRKYREAGCAIRRAKLTIVCWLALTAISLPFAFRLPEMLGDHGLTVDGSYAQVQQRLWREFRIPDAPVILLFQRDPVQPTPIFQAAIARLLRQAVRIDGVHMAASPLHRPDMQRDPYVYALLHVEGSPREQKAALAQLRNFIAEERAVKTGMTGKLVVQDDVNRSSGRDVGQAEAWGVPIAFMLLLFTLGGIGRALIPIIAGGMAIAATMAIMYAIGVFGLLPLSVFVYHVIPMAGMAVCIDFALLIISRYREERAAGSSEEAIRKTMRTAGNAVVVSAGCVLLALACTLWIRMPIFNSVACGAMVVVAMSAIINLTLVPALLQVFENRRPIGAICVQDTSAKSASRKRHRLLTIGLRRPGLSVLVALYALLLCLLPVSNMRTAVPGPESLPSGTDSRSVAETFARQFNPLSLAQVYVLVDEPDNRHVFEGVVGQGGNRVVDTGYRATIAERMQQELALDGKVIQIDAVRSPAREGATLLMLRLYGDETSNSTKQWLRDFEQRYGEWNVTIGGEAKYRQEIEDEIFNRVKYVAASVFVSNFILLALAFRSILIPLKAILMNYASIGASFGILTWIFGSGRWGMEASDIAIMIPVFLFGLVFGISMDYGVFLLSRINESYRMNRDNDRAVRDGLIGSGVIISAAAAIMIAVTLPFASADVAGVRQLGIGIAAALFIDVTLMRLILAPALMKLFGDWNWRLPFVRS